MAVITLGDALATQARNLAVERVEEGLCLLLVTPAALLHHQGPETRFVDARDRVRGMAIFAGGVFLIDIRVICEVDAGFTFVVVYLDGPEL